MLRNKIKLWVGALCICGMMAFASTSYANFTYTVKSGDTLYLVGKAYSVSVSSIKTANGLTTDNLYIGQKLIIPTDKIIEYKVVSGDTLWKIATKFNTTIDRIKELNKLTTESLMIGQVLIVEKNTMTTTTSPTQTSTQTSTYRTYTVKAGDNLWNIAVMFDVSVTGIKTLNGLTSDYLTIGQVLKIPASVVYTTDPALTAKLVKFPFASINDYDPFNSNYGAARDYGTDGVTTRSHEGQDITADTGTPVYSMATGTITNIGWTEYAGYRITIKIDGVDYSLFYAHFSKYAPGLAIGQKVYAGQLVGYVGSTGYGPEGTSGKFVSHLHVGIYKTSTFTAINPYPYLKALEY